MTNFDRVLHLLGTAAAGVVVVGSSGGVAVPAWLMITAGVVSFVTGSTSNPMVKTPSILAGKKDARGQVADSEDPR